MFIYLYHIDVTEILREALHQPQQRQPTGKIQTKIQMITQHMTPLHLCPLPPCLPQIAHVTPRHHADLPHQAHHVTMKSHVSSC